MSDPDRERSEALCRQAAKPVLRHRPDMVVPKSQPETENGTESGDTPAAARPGSVTRDAPGILDYGIWFRLPR